ncbi:MAG: hypothetical protein U0Q16_32555 [Bryobacteraceae bacterium]
MRNLAKDGPLGLWQILPAGQILTTALLAIHVAVVQRGPVSQAIHDHMADTWAAAPEETTQLRLS